LALIKGVFFNEFRHVGENRNKKYIKMFGEHLKSLRLARQLSQEELAFRCGIPLSQIARFERGERSPTLSTFLLLSTGLDIEPKKLLDFPF
jgi:transcriptional regulator with XRE-family HTH domain